MKKRIMEACLCVGFLILLGISGFREQTAIFTVRESKVLFEGKIFQTTQPILPEDMHSEVQQVKEIIYEGAENSFCFTEEHGFQKLEQGKNEINGTVKAWMFGQEEEKNAEKIKMEIKGSRSDRYILVQQEGLLKIQKIF